VRFYQLHKHYINFTYYPNEGWQPTPHQAAPALSHHPLLLQHNPEAHLAIPPPHLCDFPAVGSVPEGAILSNPQSLQLTSRYYPKDV
jgi:hypothetical protein